jgi:hypothetical protein
MAVAEQERESQTNDSSGGTRNAALKAAAAAAATGAATFAVRKALSHDDSGSNGDRGKNSQNGSGRTKSAGSSILASAAASGWDAASDVLLPIAEDAADAAGKYLAEHGPDVIRERIVPRFIEAFNDANG